MTRPKLKHIAIAWGIHLLAARLTTTFSLTLGMARFDNPELPVSRLERAFDFISAVLDQPTRFLWDVLIPDRSRMALEWPIAFLGSLIWAVPLAFLLARLTSRSTRTPPALPVLLLLVLASSTSFSASVQAGPVSFIR
jgi:hypothetical protein